MTHLVLLRRRVATPRIAFLLLLALPGLLSAQGRRGETALYEPEPPFRCEAMNAPSADSTLSRLDVHLWIAPSLLVFVRESGDTSATPFVGKADIAVEVFDSTHVARARKYVRGRIPSPTSDNLTTKAEPLRVSTSFDLPPGSYTVAAEVADAESRRRTSREQHVVLKDYRSATPQASSLLWCEETGAGEPATGSMRCWGNLLPFGHPSRGYVAVTGFTHAESLHVVLRLLGVRAPAKEPVTVLQDSFWTRGNAGVAPLADSAAGCRYLPAGSPVAGAVTIAVPLAADTVAQGTYTAQLTVSGGGASATLRQDLMLHWASMPRTLTSLTLAVQALQYVMTKEEYAALKKEDSEAQRRTFETFWRRKNPSPKSAFNAYMEEYYRRADIALQDFATIRNPNGILTDRGKVFILYGQPASKERVLGTSSAPREIWYYPALNRSLIFIDEKRTGDYTLLSEQ